MGNPHDDLNCTLELKPNPAKVGELVKWYGDGYPMESGGVWAHVTGPYGYDHHWGVAIIAPDHLDNSGFIAPAEGDYHVDMLIYPVHGKNKPPQVAASADVVVTA